ncbi:hypothetical protein EYF80_066084 [Liparis tanakae]|uniref:Uncharacterized protein n=1 Tax=Liparis tanakae TaxID=230148 RepID=A0A4Z2E5A3_9TELE|nr:hypothetical protein EYF80_066084 [Liparis tanakae]
MKKEEGKEVRKRVAMKKEEGKEVRKRVAMKKEESVIKSSTSSDVTGTSDHSSDLLRNDLRRLSEAFCWSSSPSPGSGPGSGPGVHTAARDPHR